LITSRFNSGLFPQIDQSCRDTRRDLDQLEKLWNTTDTLRRSDPQPSALGAATHP
jgi:hypothetical protein